MDSSIIASVFTCRNQIGVVHATTFYKDQGTDGLLLAVDHLDDWKLDKRYVWDDFRSGNNLRFYSQDGRKYMATGLAGQKSFWVVGLIPRSEVVLRAQPGFQRGRVADPATWLDDQLTLWNLDKYKDTLADWPEKLDGAPFDTTDSVDFQSHKPFEPMTFAAYKASYIDRGAFHELFDFAPNLGGLGGRSWEDAVAAYALSRANWTQEQRDQARPDARLLRRLLRKRRLLSATQHDRRPSQFHHGCQAGAGGNRRCFSAESPGQTLARFVHEFRPRMAERLPVKDTAGINNKGGRWTENIACYVGQSLLERQRLLFRLARLMMAHRSARIRNCWSFHSLDARSLSCRRTMVRA